MKYLDLRLYIYLISTSHITICKKYFMKNSILGHLYLIYLFVFDPLVTECTPATAKCM